MLVIGNGAVEGEDEKEDEDDLVAAPLRCAVSQVSNVSNLLPVAREQRSADYKSAIRQIGNLRYGKQIQRPRLPAIAALRHGLLRNL